MEKKAFCHFCGHPLTDMHAHGRIRPFCIRCDRPIYENPVPATCLVVVHPDRRVALVRRNVEPRIGWWCLPGGFLELGESPETGALRELREETGLNGEIDALLGVTSSSNRFYDTVLLIGYLVRRFSGAPVPGEDASEIRFFSLDHLPEIAFESHRHFLSLYQTDYGIEPGIHPDVET